jgi:hypothetical protein
MSGNGGTGGSGGSGIVIVRYVISEFTPVITNQSVSAVTTNSATCNGTLTLAGAPNPVVYVLSGTANGVWTSTNAWPQATTWANGSPLSTNITGLVPDMTYYYTFGASNSAGTTTASPAKNFITGLVTVEPTIPNTVFNGAPGQFTIRRPATCTNEAMTVYYTMSGSASHGVDYALVSGSVPLAAGATSAAVTVIAYPDLDTTSEHVVLTLTGGYNYPTGAFNSATVTIAPFVFTPTLITAVGGSVTNYTDAAHKTNYTAYIFKTVGTTNLQVTKGGFVEVLVVAGGGGGGNGTASGGGGAGGLIYTKCVFLEDGSNYTVVVGDGGNIGTVGASGGSSVFYNVTCYGGGGGGANDSAGSGGGSGGGGGCNWMAGGACTNGQGYAGGSGTQSGGYLGGGGGGAGTNGNAIGQSNGGVGKAYDLSGTNTFYAGGGGGGKFGTTGGTGGNGGGGNGAGNGQTAGGDNTGGGGGGQSNQGAGGKGGSGIVIVRSWATVPPRGTVIMMR